MKTGRKIAMNNERKRVPLLLWPFYALWRLVVWILEITGRTLAFILSLVFVFVGVLLTMTVVGAIIGIPLAIIGVMLFVAALS
jgi:hypothetical protein